MDAGCASAPWLAPRFTFDATVMLMPDGSYELGTSDPESFSHRTSTGGVSRPVALRTVSQPSDTESSIQRALRTSAAAPTSALPSLVM